MKIGAPKEIKNSEHRVAVVPAGVRELVGDGHEVFVETMAGADIGLSDEAYRQAGATIVPNVQEVFDRATMIMKIKEPQASEIPLLRPDHILYTFLHLAADRELTLALLDSGATCVSYETIEGPRGNLPLLVPMSEVAGRMSVQVGAVHLQLGHGGKGILLGGVSGTRRARVTVIGCGVAGTNALKMATGLGADVTAVDVSSQRLSYLDDLFGNRITTLYSNAETIESCVERSDLVVGSVLIPGRRAPHLVTRKMISRMEKGSVVVDIAVDQGGCTETCRPTTHQSPTFEVDGVIHYCVANMPGAVAKTSTYALTNVALPYARKMAALGPEEAAGEDPGLKLGINIYDGRLVCGPVASSLGLPFHELRFS